MQLTPSIWKFAAAFVLILAAAGCRHHSSINTAPATTATPPATAPATLPAVRRVNVFITGRVQGVGFRAFTEREARQLNLGGWVTNLPDGRVQAVIEGPAPKVANLLDLLRQGPPGSRVDSVEVTDQPVRKDLLTFRVNQ